MNNRPLILSSGLVLMTMFLLISFFLIFGNYNSSGQERDSSEDWPMFRLDYHHTGSKIGSAPNSDTLEWIFDTETNSRWVVSSPMIVDDYVYVGSDNGYLYKLNVEDGSEVWSYQAGSGTLAQFWSSPCVDKENNMVLCHASGVHAIDMTTGERIWHFDTNTREFCSPVVHDGVVFVGSYSKIAYALPQEDPNGDQVIDEDEIIWKYYAGEYQNGNHIEGTGGAISSTMAIVNEMVIGAEQTNFDEGNNYCDYNIFVLPEKDPDDSGIIEHDEIIWKYEIGTHVPIIDTGIPGDNGDCFSSPSVNIDLEQIYIGSRDQYMYAFKLYPEGDGLDNDGDGIWDNEGELVWREQVDNEVFSSPSIHNGNIYFGTGQYNYGGSPGSVYALRETDGAEIWRYQNSDGFLSSALVADNKVYIGSNDENLYAFFEENGTVKWSYNAQGGSRNAIGSSPSLYKGRVVVGSCNGMVYSFREDNVAPFVIPLFPFLFETVTTNTELEWIAIDWDEGDEEKLTYDVYLSTNIDNVINKTKSAQVVQNIKETTFKPTINEGQYYYWKIVADDGKSEGESWLSVFYVNSKPTLSNFTPMDNEIVYKNSFFISWEGADFENDKLYYDFYFGENSEPEILIQYFSEDYIEVSDLNVSQTFKWKIVAFDGMEETSSPILTFKTNTAPNINLISPADSKKTDNSINLEWDGNDKENDELIYKLYLDKNPNPTNLIKNDISTESYQISDLEEGEEYFWKVIVSDGYKEKESDIWSFTINFAPTISLQFPENETRISESSILLTWNGEDEDDEEYYYDLYFGLEYPNETIICNLTDEMYELFDLIEGEEYFWKVVIKDGISKVDSEIRNFKINTPPHVNIVGPIDKNRITSNTIILSWDGEDNDDDFISYDVYFDKKVIPTTLVSYNQEEKFYEVEDFDKGVIYYWYVIANDGFNEKSSEIYSIVVNSAPTVTLSKPTDETEISGNSISLSWDSEDNENDNLKFDVYLDTKTKPSKIVSKNQTKDTYQAKNLVSGETYYWKISVNDGYETSYSEIREFSVEKEAVITDLSISSNDISFSKTDVIVDDEIVISVVVHNNGEEALDNVNVFFFDGEPTTGILIFSEKVTIQANSMETVIYQWIAEEGIHNIYIIVEYDDEGTMAFKSINVKEKSKSTSSDEFEYKYLAIPAILLVVIVGIVVAVAKSSSDEEYYKAKEKHHPMKKCPSCNSKLEFVSEYNDYYCYECEEYLEDM